MSNDTPINEWDKSLLRALRALIFTKSVWVLQRPTDFILHVQGLVRRAYGLPSLYEKTRKSIRLQVLLQRQHFLLSNLKTVSVGPAGVWTDGLPLSRPAFIPLS